MAEPLPPYTGDEPTCPKCSHTEAYTEYKPANEPRSRSAGWGAGMPERLERRCARCDFIWDEALNPPREPGPEPDSSESPYFASLPTTTKEGSP